MITRRHLLGTAGAGAALAVSGIALPKFSEAEAAGVELSPGVPQGISSYVTMGTLPGKKPLIQLSDEPPNYEAPLEYFRTPITPNDEFFVRYHLSDIPEVDAKTYKISVGGDGANGQAEITLDDLKKMPAVEVVAVNQCSGNRRGLSKPHVAGVEWGYGAMGCARWKGARLKDMLDKVGLKKEAIEIGLQRRRRPGDRQDAGFHQEHAGLEGDGCRHHHRLRDERGAAAAFQRLPGAADRAGLDRHLLDEASHQHQRADQAARRLLDETGLPHSGRQIPGGGALHHAGRRRPRRRSPRSWSIR